MKSLKSYLIIAAAISLFVMLSYSTTANDEIMQQNSVDPDTAPLHTEQEPVVSVTVLPQPKSPILPFIRLQSLDIQVEVTGNIASTRYTMVFRNTIGHPFESYLIFPLPDGVAVTHYAMSVDGRMREAVPVENEKAAQVFEAIHQQWEVDLSVHKKVEGNNFRARVLLYPQYETYTISIGYEEELTLENNLLYYRLPLEYPRLENFTLTATIRNSGQTPIVPEDENDIRFVRAGENYVATLTRQNHRPPGMLAFALPALADIPQVIMQPTQEFFYFLASVMPVMEARRKQWSNNLAIIWDVSLSGLQRNLQREIEMLDIIFTEKKSANVHLYFLNNRFTKTGEYKVTDGDWGELKNVLETAVFDGGTSFSQINLNDIAGKEILFFSDGISTLSDADFLSNTDANQSARPIHCIVSSSGTDYGTMRLIASKTKGKFINLDVLSDEKLKEELLNETPQFLGAEHGNALSEVYPSIVTPINGYFSVAGISNTNNAELTLLFGFGDKVEKRIKVKLDAQRVVSQGNICKIWAQKKIAELDLEYEKNRDKLTELGRQFGIATRNTSLVVFSFINDYVHFGIEPPDSEPVLQAEYEYLLRHKREREARRNRRCSPKGTMLEAARTAAKKIRKWHKTDFTPKQSRQPVSSYRYPTPDNQPSTKNSLRGRLARGNSDNSQRIIAASPLPLLGIFGLLTGCSTRGRCFYFPRKTSVFGTISFDNTGRLPTRPGRGTINPFRRDNDYLEKLTENVDEDYQLYLQLRDDYANLFAFHFGMSDHFYRLGDKETAIRVLTSIVESEVENTRLYWSLGYRFKEYGEHALQKFVTQKVLQWQPTRPQSYRDYALALADNGEPQAALDSLYSILTRLFSGGVLYYSRGIEEVIVTEINHLIAKHPHLDKSRINRRLRTNIPVDLRVVVNWNVSAVDIDLYVKDPNGEDTRGQLTRTGGRLSPDIQGQYAGEGPRQFMLKNALPGKYEIHIECYDRRVSVGHDPIIVMLDIYKNYADSTEERKITTLQLQMPEGQGITLKTGRGRRILVAKVEF
ncbi:MAG: hypothetical protein LBU70_11040 [Chitinispirillales bacterium]|jgi:hypothetical protein|nr:hypothetical protein [Chitinispirillales bacterium]